MGPQNALEIVALYVALPIALVAAMAALLEARAQKEAVKQAVQQSLFNNFNLASQATISNPELMYSVHGLDRSIPIEEARSLAYLSAILDGYELYYQGRLEKMASELKKRSTFLNRILAMGENQRRWQVLKRIYYGDSDSGFVGAIDDLIAHEKGRHQAG